MSSDLLFLFTAGVLCNTCSSCLYAQEGTHIYRFQYQVDLLRLPAFCGCHTNQNEVFTLLGRVGKTTLCNNACTCSFCGTERRKGSKICMNLQCERLVLYTHIFHHNILNIMDRHYKLTFGL